MNGDDAPLSDLRVQALARDRPLVLAEGFTPPYRLFYGATGLAAPAYDFAQLACDARSAWIERREARSAARSSTRTSSLPLTRARSSREIPNVVNGLLVLAALVAAVGGLLALRRRA